jgi:uncharacterized integral membrane protein
MLDKHEMGGECSMHGEEKRFIHNYSQKTRKETTTWTSVAHKIIIIIIIIIIIQNNQHVK